MGSLLENQDKALMPLFNLFQYSKYTKSVELIDFVMLKFLMVDIHAVHIFADLQKKIEIEPTQIIQNSIKNTSSQEPLDIAQYYNWMSSIRLLSIGRGIRMTSASNSQGI